MSDLGIIGAMAAITYASRVVFLLRDAEAPGGLVGRFLEVFPLALFVSLGTLGLAAPDGDLDVTIGLWAGAGGLLGAVLTKRPLIGILAFGAAAWWAAKLLV